MPIFHRDSTASSSSNRSVEDPNKPRNSHKLFSSQSSRSSVSGSSTTSPRLHGLLHRTHDDPSIQAARQQVYRAETAEREADKALMASRKAVKDAREHVKHLEREAAEE